MPESPPRTAPLVTLDVSDGVATIAINRPAELNSITPLVLHLLQLAFDQAIADPEVNGIVLTGKGKVFVVGADIEFFIRNMHAGDIPRIVKFTEAGHRLFNTIDNSPKPVVAQVHGAALGGGTELALACDCVVAAPTASFGFPETGLGIYPGFGGTQRAPRRLGIGLAKWLIFTGKTLSATDARAIGLVQQLVGIEEIESVARAIAAGHAVGGGEPAMTSDLRALEHFFNGHRAEDLRRGLCDVAEQPVIARAMKLVASKGPIALRLAEQLIDEGMRRSVQDGLQLEIDHVNDIFTTEDALTGLTFRASQRLGQPGFQGR